MAWIRPPHQNPPWAVTSAAMSLCAQMGRADLWLFHTRQTNAFLRFDRRGLLEMERTLTGSRDADTHRFVVLGCTAYRNHTYNTPVLLLVHKVLHSTCSCALWPPEYSYLRRPSGGGGVWTPRPCASPGCPGGSTFGLFGPCGACCTIRRINLPNLWPRRAPPRNRAPFPEPRCFCAPLPASSSRRRRPPLAPRSCVWDKSPSGASFDLSALKQTFTVTGGDIDYGSCRAGLLHMRST